MFMKHISVILSVLLISTFTAFGADKIVDAPSYSASTTQMIGIKQIVLSDNATIFHMEAYGAGRSFSLDPKSLITANGKSYAIVSAKDLELGKNVYIPKTGTMLFDLQFPAIPKQTKSISFIENDTEGAFCFYDIRLDNKQVQVKFRGKAVETAESIETETFKNGASIIKGTILGYKPEMKLKGHLNYRNMLSGNNEDIPFSVAEDGTFSIKTVLDHPTNANITSTMFSAKICLKPEGIASVEINLPEITRAASKLLQNKPSLGKGYLFEGSYASINNGYANLSDKLPSISPTTQQEFMQQVKEIATMNASQYKNYWLTRRDDAISKIKQVPSISPSFQEVAEESINLTTAMQLISHPIESYYRYINHISQDSVLKDYTKPVFDKDYYDFLPKLVPNSSKLFYAPEAYGIVYYLKSDSIARNNLALQMGTDKGVLFDLIKAQSLATHITDFEPFTNEQLAEVKTLPTNISSKLISMNEKLKKTIDENKLKTGYTINRIDTTGISKEDFLTEVLKPYKGKVVFIDFWATWCGPCKRAMVESTPVKNEFLGKDVIFLYIAGDNSPYGTWMQTIPDIKGDHYRVNKEFWNYLMMKYDFGGIPAYMIIAKDGTMTHKQIAFMGVDSMRAMLKKEIQK